jgi:hypothetical protein
MIDVASHKSDKNRAVERFFAAGIQSNIISIFIYNITSNLYTHVCILMYINIHLHIYVIIIVILF